MLLYRTIGDLLLAAALLTLGGHVAGQEDSLLQRIDDANTLRERSYTLRGDLSVHDDGRVRIAFTNEAFALISPEHIDPSSIFPLNDGEDPSGRNSLFAVKVLKGAVVELHVGDVAHTFTLHDHTRPFYVEDGQLRYLDAKDPAGPDCEYKCRKWVIVADVYCCGGGFAHGGFGYVGCSDDWCDERKCCRHSAESVGAVYSDVALGVNDVATVSSGADNGANNCIARAFTQNRRHGTSREAVTNLLGLLPAFASREGDSCGGEDDNGDVAALGIKNPWIAGHGNEGFFTSGMGQTGEFHVSKYVATWTQYNWGPEFRRLRDRSFPILTIVSCHTGAGPDGAEFLYEVAKVVNRPVRARTGFTYCGGSGNITYENGSVWQYATPTHRPDPIPAPSPHLALDEEVRAMIVFIEGERTEVPITAVTRISFTPGERLGANQVAFTVDGDVARGIARRVAFSRPFATGGEPLAVVTGTLEVTYAQDGQEKKRTFVIYNERLLQDAADRSRFYYALPGFRQALTAAATRR